METVIKRIKKLWPLIESVARQFKLEPALLAGLVAQESGGQRYASRAEPRWEYHNMDLPRPPESSSVTERQGQATSWGLCQVMGTVAREKGFNGWFAALSDPEIGLRYGAEILSGFIAWARRRGGWRGETDPIRAGLLRYNGGGYRAYPDKVLEWRDKIAEAINEPQA